MSYNKPSFLKGSDSVGSYMSTSMSLRPKRDLQFSHCVCDASLAAIKKSSYELDVPFCALCVLALLLQKKSFSWNSQRYSLRWKAQLGTNENYRGWGKNECFYKKWHVEKNIEVSPHKGFRNLQTRKGIFGRQDITLHCNDDTYGISWWIM